MEPETIESICRKYAVVELRKEPYDARLTELDTKIKQSYESSFGAYVKLQDQVAGIVEDLEEVKSQNGFLKGFRERLNGGNGKYKEEVKKASEEIKQKGEKLSSLESLINDCYNEQARFIHLVSSYMNNIEDTAQEYKRRLESIGKELMELYEKHQDSTKLSEHVRALIIEKEKSEKPLTDEERENNSAYNRKRKSADG